MPVDIRLIKATIKVGSEDFTTHFSTYKFVPTPVTTEFTDVSGTVHKLAGESGWALTLGVRQDFSTTGFARKCFDSEGEKVSITVEDGPVIWTSDITLVAPEIGGDPKTVGISTISFPASRPVPTAAPVQPKAGA